MIPVSDVRSNSRDQIGHAVEVLGRSKARLAVFSAIYRGKKKIKAVNEIAASTGLSRVRVLQEGLRLSSNELVEQLRLGGEGEGAEAGPDQGFPGEPGGPGRRTGFQARCRR